MCNLPTVVSSFLLVALNIDAILGEITLYQRRKKLDEMTKGEGLGDAYEATLSRMKAQSRSRSKLGMDILMWVSHAERPLHVDELCHALGVEAGSIDLNTQNIPAIETLLACTLGLVRVEKSSSTVRLVHYTLQEYLSHNPNLFLEPHSLIAEVCLTYLNFRQVKGLSPARRSVPPTAPFVEYASCHWGSHARQGSTESVKALALKLLDGYDKHISSKILLLRGLDSWDRPFDRKDTPRGFTGLHGAAYLGYAEIIVTLLETNKWDVQATDFHGSTAIAWAARRGHEGAVRVLLQRSDASPDKADKWSLTPLLWAAETGYEGVVRMLLERNDVNPDKADKWSQTPLLQAAANGHVGVAKMLLERNDINPNKADEDNQTPLSWAANNGHEGVVRMLLERNDVNPDEADKWSQTPLLRAAASGHERVVMMVLERNDVNPNKADEDSQTPLSWAANNGHEEVVRMLLERNNLNPDKADKWGQTPLLRAAANGHEGVVKMLLERNDINPDKADRWSQTPLLRAAANGYGDVVKILLERKNVNPDSPNTEYRQTPPSRMQRCRASKRI